MFKRMISFVLALVLTLGILSPATVFAEENSDGEVMTEETSDDSADNSETRTDGEDERASGEVLPDISPETSLQDNSNKTNMSSEDLELPSSQGGEEIPECESIYLHMNTQTRSNANKVPLSDQLKSVYPPYIKVQATYSDKVTCGTARYISQVSKYSPFFSWDYWPENSYGNYESPDNECGTSCISMALSYIGINRTPESLVMDDNYKGSTAKMFSGVDGTTYDSYAVKDLSAVVDQYVSGNGKYSPVVIHLNYGQSIQQNDPGHYVMIVGKVSDNVYQIMDPAADWLMDYTINGTAIHYLGVDNTIDQVHQWYNPNGGIGYIASCENYPSYGQLTVTAGTSIMSQPCAANVSAESTQVETAAAGASYTATALYRNDQNQYWYQITAKSTGKTAYIRADNTAFRHLEDDIAVNITSIPTQHLHKDPFALEGSITSEYNGIVKVSAYVYEGNAVSGNAYAGTTHTLNAPRHSYSLKGSNVDNGTAFGSVPLGSKNLVVRAFFESHYVEAGALKTAETVREHTYPFQVISASSCTVTFDVNGGEGSNTVNTVEAGSTLAAIALPSRSGYTCIGWGTSANAAQAAYQPGDAIAVNGNMTLYALWEAVANPEKPGDNLTWTVNDSGILTISGSGAMYNFMAGEAPWNSVRYAITGVVISSGVTSIGDFAFYCCANMKTIQIADTVKTLGQNAFFQCSSLERIDIPSGVTTIPNGVFSLCTALSAVSIPEGVTYIESSAFGNCSSLTQITLPGSLKSINSEAFSNCTGLTSVSIGKNVTGLRVAAFRNCTALREIQVDPANTSYRSIDGVLFNRSMGHLQHYPAAKTDTTYTIPDGVITVGGYAFEHAANLTAITIPDSVVSVGTNGFQGCTGLKDVYYTGAQEQWNKIYLESGNEPVKNATLHCLGTVEIPSGSCGENLTWKLEDGVLTISGTGDMTSYPWKDYSDEIESLVIGEGVTSICNFAFQGCFGLTDVVIPANVTRIGSASFNGTFITSVMVQGPAIIDSYAFSSCTNLKMVGLTKDTRVSTGAFDAYCTGLTDVWFTGSEADWTDYSAYMVGPENSALLNASNKYFNWNGASFVVSGVCGDNMTWSIDASTGVMTIGGFGAMRDYKDPRDIYAFSGELAPWNKYAGQITGIALGPNVSAVGDYAFSECGELKTVTIPLGMKNVGKYAFRSASKLTDIYYSGTDTEWATLKTRAETGNTPLFKDTVIIHTNWGERENILSGNCGDGVVWVLDKDTGKMTISGSGAMDDYWGGHGDYQPEPRYTPWNDVYTQIKSVVIESGVTKIGMYSFANCQLTEVTIPNTVTSINHHAFKDNLKLTDVYYDGSKEEWNALIPNVGSGNEYLLGAPNMHYAGGEEISELPDIRYYFDWNESEQRIYFGPEDTVGCLVSDETESSFFDNPTAYQGMYVMVQTQKSGGQETLLWMRPPVTGVGTVKSVTDTQITIEDYTYNLAEGFTDPNSYLGKTVVHHMYAGEIIGMDVLQEKTGFLTYYREDAAMMRIQPSKTDSNGKIYYLSLYAQENTLTFLKWSVKGAYETNVPVTYLADSFGMLFEVLPKVDYRVNGFSEDRHGWSIPNHETSFAYPSTYYIQPWLYYAHGESSKNISETNYKKEKWEWSGNCFGLSMLAVAQYHGDLNLKPYFSQTGSTLNEFGYESIADIGNGVNAFVLYRDVSGTKVQNEAIIRAIEQAQVAQFADVVTDNMKHYVEEGELLAFVNTMSRDDAKPVVVGMEPHSHAVVTDTTVKPVFIGNGQYLIPLYDSNAPQSERASSTFWNVYYYPQSALLIDVSNNAWGYVYNGKIKNDTLYRCEGELRLYYYDFSDVDESFFDNHYDFNSEQITIVYGAFGRVVKIYSADSSTGQRTLVFELVDGKPTFYVDSGKYLPYLEGMENGSSMEKGAIQLPMGNYVVETDGEAYIQCMYDNDIFAVNAESGVEIGLNVHEDTLSIMGTQEDTGVSCVHASSDVDFCTVVDSELNDGSVVTLTTDSQEKTASVTTNLDTDSVDMVHSVDGECIDITPDMIHQHKDLTFKADAEADCTNPGSKAHYICQCGKTFADANASKEITDAVIPALGHIGQWVPTQNEGEESRTCERCGDVEVRVTGNRLVMDSAVLGDHASVWIEGVEYPVEDQDGQSVIRLPEGDSFHMTTYTFHVGDAEDIHTQYPTDMQVWKITKGEDGKYTAVLIPELDNILQYSGSSIRITGNKGIRMITSIAQDNKYALTSGAGLGGYKLLEYGTALCFASELEGGKSLVLGQEYTRSNYAYKKDVADPVFAYSGNLMQYTNVLVGFNNDQCKEDIAMRPYMILEDAEGTQVTIYGGTVYRSIGYIAWQNRTVFNPGTAAYDFVWDIIHYVYGDQYDEDYQGE